jgi:hypothetical protein
MCQAMFVSKMVTTNQANVGINMWFMLSCHLSSTKNLQYIYALGEDT